MLPIATPIAIASQQKLQAFAHTMNVPLFLSPKEFCTDNAVMIGGLALLRLAAGEHDELALAAEPLSQLRIS